jgi:hypothetical protein
VTDREFLIWIHERLELVHCENPLLDYMHRLRAIIRSTPVNRCSKKYYTCNSLTEMLEDMKKEREGK